MNPKLKAALTAIIITAVLTVLKFVLYFLSGSLAVFSEAWHGFSDVATTAFVFLAIWHVLRRNAAKEGQGEKDGEEDADKKKLTGKTGGKLRSLAARLGKINPELAASFGIGMVLLFIASSIIWKVFTRPPSEVSRPLMTGIIFIIFSGGSYFLYRFKTTAGKRHDSMALVADGFHSLADMVVALLTGFCLILYRFGVNLDKTFGFIIALFILSFAVETLINTTVSIVKKKKQVDVEYHSSAFLNKIFKKEIYAALPAIISRLLRKLSGLLRKSALVFRLLRWASRAAAAALLLAYFSTSLCRVGADEQLIVERLGCPVDPQTPAGPGLHLKLPWPFDRVVKINTKKVRALNLGNMTGTDLPLIWTVPHGNEMHFISGDNNFFNPYIVVHYRVKDMYAYHYSHARPEKLLEYTSYNILSKTFAVESFYDVSIFARRTWQNSCRHSIQEKMDALGTGIEVLGFLAKDMHPPLSVATSFEEVIAAYQEKERLINEGNAYKNVQIPAARIMAFHEEKDASAYVLDKVKRATGDAERYLSKLEQYNRAKATFRRIFYFETMKETLRRNVKILIDPKAEVEDIWLKQ